MDDDESTISSLGTLLEDHFYEDLNNDPMLSKEDAEAFMSPPQQAWINANPNDAPAIVKIDTSTEQQWKLARMEIDHVKATMHRLIGVTYDKDQDKDGVVLKRRTILHLLGKTSKVATFFKENASLSDTKYLQFMHTFCMQAAYNCSSRQLFYKCLKLQKALLLSETEYNGVWQWLANRKKIDNASVSTSRRSKPLWTSLQAIINEILRSISIEDREGRISVALDDDKVNLCFVFVIFAF